VTFISKQFIDVIQWIETEPGVLAWRFPMEDMEIQNGAKLTVRETQSAVFVNEGIVADTFGPGLHTLTTKTLPFLTNLKNWDKAFQSPFKSDVYFYSQRLQVNHRWGTSNPISFRDKDFGAVRLRAHGIYSYSLVDPKTFYTKVSGTTPVFKVAELEGQLRNTIVGMVADTFAESSIPFLDMAANQVELGAKLSALLMPVFTSFGLQLESFVVESISLPEELQKRLDERIGISMVGDLSRYTQFQVAQSVTAAASNEGGNAGLGAGLGVGMVMAQKIMAVTDSGSRQHEPISPPSTELKFCVDCGYKIPKRAKFCSECGQSQN
jgi:membrane protease subunit (stomatin/prohibitin family)